MQKWENSVGNKIESKLKKEFANVKSLIDVQLYNRVSGKYSVQLSNNWRLVVNLTNREYNCMWWQIQGFLRRHAMAVIKEKKWPK